MSVLKREELLDKLFRLEKNKAEVTKMKKSMSADYRDQLKGINDEIKEVMEDLDDISVPGSGPVEFEEKIEEEI